MTCEDYFEDPEKNAAHLESCELCRSMNEELDADLEVSPRPIDLNALPMATWEGASHRTWPLVAAGVAAVLILAVVLFLAAGMPPLRGLTSAVTTSLTSYEAASKFFPLVGNGLHSAPMVVHIAIGVLFVAINTILFLLLRRSPRGIDV
ncbi:MAG TPA: hypothetical protein VEK11_04475 [Thermoanaerobaculia bacterium]|nr:hypothetical protein [Thermoanaerobaculia bacterium]